MGSFFRCIFCVDVKRGTGGCLRKMEKAGVNSASTLAGPGNSKASGNHNASESNDPRGVKVTDPHLLEEWALAPPPPNIDDPLKWGSGPTPACTYSRFLIFRDYTNWRTVKFSEKIPPVLVQEMNVEERVWTRTLEEINKICAKMDQVNCATFLDTLAYFFFIPRKKNTRKCMERVAAYIDKENKNIYDSLGLEFKDPALTGYRYIEVVVKYLRFRMSKPILPWGVDYPSNPKIHRLSGSTNSSSDGSSLASIPPNSNTQITKV